ncbi:MAG: MFS transporter [Chloroflexi bacterium]|nr:MFS transporter [Chloroflexota bacterium]
MRPLLAAPRRLDHKWWVFGTIALGTFVSVLDQSGVNLALPRLATHFDATIPEVQWVTLGYMLTTGALLLPMGRLSDMVGRKRVYTSGLVVFVVGALLAGISTELLGVILFKVLQGVGAAMIQSNGMAIVTSTFAPSERGKAIGLFLTVVGVGAIAGPVVGGAVVGAFGWRFIFFMGLPFGLASIVAALVVLEGRSAEDSLRGGGQGSFDWVGAFLSSAALATFLLVMTNAHRVGWGSPIVAAAMAGVVMLFVAFLWWERRAPDPMLALELFRRRLFSLGNSASFLVFLAGTSVFFLMPFYLQGVLGYSPGRAGLTMAPTAIAFAVLGPISGRLSDRYGWKRFAVAGLVASLVSMLMLSRLGTTASGGQVVTALAFQGIGMGMFFSPNASAVLSTVERERYGIATAFMNMVRNIASVTGVGLATAVVTATMGSMGFEPTLDAVSSGDAAGAREAFTEGLSRAYIVTAGFVALALVLTIFGGHQREAARAEADRSLPSKV